MKSGLRAIMNVTGLALCLVFAVTATVQAQNREKYVISAKAGGINSLIKSSSPPESKTRA